MTFLLELAPGVSTLKVIFTEFMASVPTHSSIRATKDSVESALAIWRIGTFAQN